MNGASTVPAVRWRLASRPMPLPHVWGVKILPAAATSRASSAQPGDAPACTRSRVGRRRGSPARAARGTRRARGSSRPPRSATAPAAAARRTRRSRRGAAAPPSSRRPRRPATSATSVARSTSHGGLRVPRHPPALVAVDHELEAVADRVAHRASPRRGRRSAPDARSAPSAPGSRAPPPARPPPPCRRPSGARRSTRRRAPAGSGPPSSCQTGCSRIWPARSQRATSSGHGRPAWNSMFGEHGVVTVEVERVLAEEVLAVVGEAVHGVAGADPDVAVVVGAPARSWPGSGCGAGGPTTRGRAGRAAAGGARCRWRRSGSSISARVWTSVVAGLASLSSGFGGIGARPRPDRGRRPGLRAADVPVVRTLDRHGLLSAARAVACGRRAHAGRRACRPR